MDYRSLKVIQAGTIRKLGYGFLYTFNSNYMVVSLAIAEIIIIIIINQALI